MSAKLHSKLQCLLEGLFIALMARHIIGMLLANDQDKWVSVRTVTSWPQVAKLSDVPVVYFCALFLSVPVSRVCTVLFLF